MPRPSWASVPPTVKAWAAELLGDEIVEATSQAGGFSPGTADIVVTAGGKRAFIKAAGLELNDRTPDIHRSEARISESLRLSSAVPRLIDSYDDGDWVALAFDVIDGLAPSLPWRRADIRSVLDSCAALRSVPAPAGVPVFSAVLDGLTSSWRQLVDSGEPLPDYLEPATATAINRLSAGLPSLEGENLLHVDLRADNVLIRPDGSAVIVDWPWAARGAPWIDPVCLLFNVLLYDPDYPVEGELGHPAFEGSTPQAIDGLLAALAGYFIAESILPAEKGVETVRAFQRDQAVTILGWLRTRGAMG